VTETTNRVRLVDLPGCAGEVYAASVASVTEATGFLRQRVAITSAGSTGAMNVWYDDAGVLRGEFLRHLMVLDRTEAKHVSEYRQIRDVTVWMRKWWKQLGR
jgi:hypothetical protein